jgi:hypothetical protein
VQDGFVIHAALRIDDAGAWLRPIATRAEARLTSLFSRVFGKRAGSGR